MCEDDVVVEDCTDTRVQREGWGGDGIEHGLAVMGGGLG